MGGMDWINLAQNRGEWRAVVKAVLYFRVPQNAEKSSLAVNLLASQE
jgi:hypothetical protein